MKCPCSPFPSSLPVLTLTVSSLILLIPFPGVNPTRVWGILFLLASTYSSECQASGSLTSLLSGHPAGAPRLRCLAVFTCQSDYCSLWFLGMLMNRLHVQGDGPADRSHTVQTPGPTRVSPLLALVSEQVGGRAGRGGFGVYRWARCPYLLLVYGATQTFWLSLPYETGSHMHGSSLGSHYHMWLPNVIQSRKWQWN